MSSLCMGEDFCEELTCAVCLDSWKEPVELAPCGHIFCKECTVGLTECPVCREKIASSGQPNRTLVNMALQIRVKCVRCGWQGTREQGMRHECGSGPAQPTRPSAISSAAKPSAPVAAPTGADSPTSNPYADYEGYMMNAEGASLWTSGKPLTPPPPPPPRPRPPQTIEPTGPRPWTLYNFTQEEYDQIVSLFVFFDADDSGSLDKQEVTRLTRWLNFVNSPQDVDRIFQEMDADHGGSLSLGEFLTWLSRNKPNPKALYDMTPTQYNTIMMQFHLYDRDQDGYLNQGDFTNLVQRLGEVRDPNTARRLFEMIDRNHSGHISLHDFLQFRAGRVH